VPKVKQEASINSLRHTEYYGMQQTYDDLYAKSKNGEQFPPKVNKQVVTSHICDKRLKAERDKLVAQAKRIARPRHGKTELDEVRIYNAMVMGIQEYYKIATAVNLDCRYLHRAVMTVLTSRLKTQCGNRLVKSGRKLTQTERSRYGKSAMLRYMAGSDEPIYPIGYIQHKNP